MIIFIICIFNILQSRKINDIGQLLTREHLPIGNPLTISYENTQVQSSELGYFVLKQEPFTVDVFGQFKQSFYPTNGVTKFIIDNNQSTTIKLSGYVDQKATLLLNVSQPLYLKQKEYQINGQFVISEEIMKMYIYECTITISSYSYKNYTKIIDLYGSYEFDFGIINLMLAETEATITFPYSNDQQCYLMCTTKTSISVLSNYSNHGIVQFQGKLMDEWPQLCLVYSNNEQGRILNLEYPRSDLTRSDL